MAPPAAAVISVDSRITCSKCLEEVAAEEVAAAQAMDRHATQRDADLAAALRS